MYTQKLKKNIFYIKLALSKSPTDSPTIQTKTQHPTHMSDKNSHLDLLRNIFRYFRSKMGSMAQPRNRVKYSIDPNVLNWAQNENKFGQKLMEKMGWTSGKGLGAHEDGMTEHIRVKVKSDNRGVGYSKQEYDNVWLDHQDEFDAVLAALNQSNKGAKAANEEGELYQYIFSNERNIIVVLILY